MDHPSSESSLDEEEHDVKLSLRRKKRLYTPRTRTRRIITAGPSQDPNVPIAESDLLDFRNRTSSILHPPLHEILPNPSNVTSEYDASCESIDIKSSDVDSHEVTESEATLTQAGKIRCQESTSNDDPNEGLPQSLNAHESFDAGYLASSDSMSTSDFRAAIVPYTQTPDVSQWKANKNPEIRFNYQLIYDRFPAPLSNLLQRLSISVGHPPENMTENHTEQESFRLHYRHTGQTTSGGSIVESSVSVNPGPEPGAVPPTDSQANDEEVNLEDLAYDEDFEAMLIERIQKQICRLGGIGAGGYTQSNSAVLSSGGREIKQRFELLQDISDEDDESSTPSIQRERGRRRSRQVPEWLLTDVPSNETLQTEVGAPPSALTIEDRLAELHPARHSAPPDSPSEVSAMQDIRAEGGDQFVEAVLWRLQESLQSSNNFREYRHSMAAKRAQERRMSRHHAAEPVEQPMEGSTEEEEESEAASSKSSTGRVTFQDKVLVRPLGADPLLTEYRKPYSKVSRQKLSAVQEYRPTPDDPDYEDSLKDKLEGIKHRSQPAEGSTPSPPARKPQPGWKKLFCCADDTIQEPAPPKPEVTGARPRFSSEFKKKRQRHKVKTLNVKDLDPNVPNEELVMLHMLFDDQTELCKLSDPETESSIDNRSELSDPDSEQEPSFAEFLKACGLTDEKVDSYMRYYKSNKALSGSGHGDWRRAGRRSGSENSNDEPGWWDNNARERRLEFRRKRRAHHEYQRQIETQSDLEVEAQLRRALETQRELIREREVQRELDRTHEESKERKELRLEEEMMEKELLKRLLAELQNEQIRGKEREKRRTVAKILEDELIMRLQLELERQREKSEERKILRATQTLDEDDNTLELSNRIEDLRVRIEENKILRDNEKIEEQKRLRILEELLDKERRRMDMKESLRLRDQDLEVCDREFLVQLEAQSAQEEAKSQKEFQEATIAKDNVKHKTMRAKLTTEIRKREIVKRKLISLHDIEKSNPRLFQLAKVMEGVADEKGCVTLEFMDDGSVPGILKKDSKSSNAGDEQDDSGTETEEKDEAAASAKDDKVESPPIETKNTPDAENLEQSSFASAASAEASADDETTDPDKQDTYSPDATDTDSIRQEGETTVVHETAPDEGEEPAGDDAETDEMTAADAVTVPTAEEADTGESDSQNPAESKPFQEETVVSDHTEKEEGIDKGAMATRESGVQVGDSNSPQEQADESERDPELPEETTNIEQTTEPREHLTQSQEDGVDAVDIPGGSANKEADEHQPAEASVEPSAAHEQATTEESSSDTQGITSTDEQEPGQTSEETTESREQTTTETESTSETTPEEMVQTEENTATGTSVSGAEESAQSEASEPEPAGYTAVVSQEAAAADQDGDQDGTIVTDQAGQEASTDGQGDSTTLDAMAAGVEDLYDIDAQ